MIYRISDDQTAVVVEDSSAEQDFEAFRHKLCSTVDSRGNPAPRYAVYDVEYDLGDDGKRCKTVFISWVPASTPLKVGSPSLHLFTYLGQVWAEDIAVHALREHQRAAAERAWCQIIHPRRYTWWDRMEDRAKRGQWG